MNASARQQLEQRQVEILEGLLGATSEPPRGFDADAWSRARAGLLAKRWANVLRRYAMLSKALGDEARTLFGDYARSVALPAEGVSEDGRRFASEMLDQGKGDRELLEPIARPRRRSWIARITQVARFVKR